MSIEISFATPDDASILHQFIVELAEYEKEPDAVEVVPETLRDQLASTSPPFEALVARWEGEPAGFALFFHNYSTWTGSRGLYLEDLLVSSGFRGLGIGRALMVELAQIARDRGCARFEWSVLDWNTPAREFYEHLGAKSKTDWMPYRLSGKALTALGT